MHDIYRSRRTSGYSYRSTPGLPAPASHGETAWTGLIGWICRLVLIVVLGAGLTRLVLEITGA